MQSSVIKLYMKQADGSLTQTYVFSVLNYLAQVYWFMLHMQPISRFTFKWLLAFNNKQ